MLILRLVLSLAFVAVLMLVAFRVAAKRTKGSGTGAMEVLARQPLTRTTSVSLVRVGDRAFVIGSGESHVTLIGETDLSEAQAYLPAAPSPLLGSTVVEGAAVQGAAPATGTAVALSKPRVTTGTGPMAGSVFDATMWRSALNGLREATVRR